MSETTLYVGDVVIDEDDAEPDDDVLIVTNRYVKTAAEYECEDGETVAEKNPDYPADDRVFGVKYVATYTMRIDTLKEYAFPRSRLALVYSPHRRPGRE